MFHVFSQFYAHLTASTVFANNNAHVTQGMWFYGFVRARRVSGRTNKWLFGKDFIYYIIRSLYCRTKLLMHQSQQQKLAFHKSAAKLLIPHKESKEEKLG